MFFLIWIATLGTFYNCICFWQRKRFFRRRRAFFWTKWSRIGICLCSFLHNIIAWPLCSLASTSTARQLSQNRLSLSGAFISTFRVNCITRRISFDGMPCKWETHIVDDYLCHASFVPTWRLRPHTKMTIAVVIYIQFRGLPRSYHTWGLFWKVGVSRVSTAGAGEEVLMALLPLVSLFFGRQYLVGINVIVALNVVVWLCYLLTWSRSGIFRPLKHSMDMKSKLIWKEIIKLFYTVSNTVLCGIVQTFSNVVKRVENT